MARENEFPSIVGIALINSARPLEQNILCTATLISSRHVLTCEHCFDDLKNDRIVIVAESVDITRAVRYNPKWWITFDQWTFSRNADLKHHDNDIGVIKVT
jgi:secreted trypsin-like serine protease